MNDLHERIEALFRKTESVALYAAAAACKVGNSERQQVCEELARESREFLDDINAVGGVDYAELAQAKYWETEG